MIEPVCSISHLLKSFSSSSVTFATADNSIAATGIGTGTVLAGECFRISGASEGANNRTFTAKEVTANKIIVEEPVAAESPGSSVTLNEEYIGDWFDTYHLTDVVGTINTSHNCTVFIDYSQNRANADHSVSIAVTGGTSLKINDVVAAPSARLRVLNGGTNQTTMRVAAYGKR